MAWSLLQKLVEDNELKDSTLIRKCVVNRILTLNAFVPQWLCDSYKLANTRELLHLYVKHNRLLEAADLACEMIGAMLGAGSEYFDFKYSVNVTNPQLSFPINTIDLLLHGLQVNGKQHIEYEMVCDARHDRFPLSKFIFVIPAGVSQTRGGGSPLCGDCETHNR